MKRHISRNTIIAVAELPQQAEAVAGMARVLRAQLVQRRAAEDSATHLVSERFLGVLRSHLA
jgi:hypothetical protein